MTSPARPAQSEIVQSQFSLPPAEFITMMAAVMALQALAIDAMLPALGQLSSDLGVTDPNRRQLVVGVFLLSAGIASLLPGSLADRFGRRRTLLIALGLYIVFALACAVAPTFEILLVLRMCQAVGSAGLVVMPSTIIRDRFSGDRMARMSSTVSMVFMIVPILAPTLGQFVLLFAGWRWIFAVLAMLAGVVTVWVWLRLPETLDPRFRQPISLRPILANMATAAFTRQSVGYVIGSGLVMGSVYGFINSSQQLLSEHFGAGKAFPLLFAACAVALAIANFTNSRIVERFGARRVSHAAVLCFIAVSALQVYLATRPHQTIWQFVPVMAANMCLIGFIGANFSSIALQPFAKIAGAASSAHAFMRTGLGAAIGIVIGQAYDGTARPLAVALLLCGLLSMAIVLFSEHGRLFRRLHPAGTPRPEV